MKTLLRGAFVGLAVLAAAAQAAQIRADAHRAPPPGLEEALAGMGFRVAPSPDPEVVEAEAPGCDAPVLLTRLHFDGLGRAASRALLEGASTPRFIYLGLADERIDRAAIAGRWVLAGLLRAVGLRDQEVPREVVVASLPAQCPELAGLDWSRASPWR